MISFHPSRRPFPPSGRRSSPSVHSRHFLAPCLDWPRLGSKSKPTLSSIESTPCYRRPNAGSARSRAVVPTLKRLPREKPTSTAAHPAVSPRYAPLPTSSTANPPHSSKKKNHPRSPSSTSPVASDVHCAYRLAQSTPSSALPSTCTPSFATNAPAVSSVCRRVQSTASKCVRWRSLPTPGGGRRRKLHRTPDTPSHRHRRPRRNLWLNRRQSPYDVSRNQTTPPTPAPLTWTLARPTVATSEPPSGPWPRKRLARWRQYRRRPPVTARSVHDQHATHGHAADATGD